MTYAAPQAGSVTYAAPQAGSVTYAAAPSATMMPGSYVYGAPAEPAGQPISTMAYGAPTMTYAAPQMYAAPASNQPVYTISPERFQLILAGQPLTNEEIMAMTGQAAAPVGTQIAGGSASVVMPQQSVAGAGFAMPDMFSTPGITNVYQATGQTPPAASAVEPTASTAIPAASAVVESTASAPTPATSSDKKEKKSSKKSSKKKLSSKKKDK